LGSLPSNAWLPSETGIGRQRQEPPVEKDLRAKDSVMGLDVKRC
jgi:hypothetical protein